MILNEIFGVKERFRHWFCCFLLCCAATIEFDGICTLPICSKSLFRKGECCCYSVGGTYIGDEILILSDSTLERLSICAESFYCFRALSPFAVSAWLLSWATVMLETMKSGRFFCWLDDLPDSFTFCLNEAGALLPRLVLSFCDRISVLLGAACC